MLNNREHCTAPTSPTPFPAPRAGLALLATHHRLPGPRRDPRTLPASWEVIEESHAGKQSTLPVRTSEPVLDPAWTVRPISLEDLVLAYMSQPGNAAGADLAGLEIAS